MLQYLSPDNKVVTMLFLKWLGMDVEAPKAEELINAIRSSLDPIFLPALRRVLGINVDCRKECSRLSNAEICNMACTAADGDKHALKELIEFIRGIKPDLADALANFSPRAIVQALAPKSSLGMLALILNALLSNDYESAKAIAIVGEYASNVRILKQLFGDLHKAIDEGGNVDGIKLALAKLYYLQV
ncbi:hypothetical protein [Vulcanisaeta distributa]|uniref:hypothetical protein n=1 Tax=Vulcanisaeta distributa TaxID=164451 RepID=UPI0006D21CF6|nr:hypothetical protein [Vulcanisaeta distributa]